MWRKHPAGKQRSPVGARLGFLGEQEPQYELKTRLARSFRGLPNVRAAYLTRVSDGASVGLRLCVRTELGHDECVLRCAESAFASLATGSPAVDILFIDAGQERELRRVCAPFYAGKF